MLIARGRAEGWLRLPVSALRVWADVHDVTFQGITVGPLPGFELRGSTVIADGTLSAGNAEPLMIIPRDLVLSLEAVRMHAKADQRLREVVDALADFGRRDEAAYIKFLPEELLPTFWTEAERDLLTGTSLKPAIEAKIKSLNKEFEQLRSATEHIKWCAEELWDDEDGLLSFDDWLQVDAMYRSRALEFPGIGDIALYETDSDGNAVLLLRDGKELKKGDEITITYGDKKGACEMLFSYGFIEDSMTSAQELFLDLEIPNDDPLKRAKLHINTAAPGFRLFDSADAEAPAGSTGWQSDFVWLVVVNEEDGLEFEVAQTTDGGRELRVYWDGAVLEEPDKLTDKLKTHQLWNVYRLRAVSLIQDRVEAQLRLLYSTDHEVKTAQRGDGIGIRERMWSLTTRLRDLERDLLERAYGDLEEEKEKLVETETVQQYLQAMAQQEPEEDFT
ncbi:putative set domain-containing protein [Diplodia seriata]|uniref:Putative set domain-containing protein n=1 Tax=Diplodia seriata TaxID=420778 RepID=A0A0G2DYV6_9PEZI|nr:putative set domain-containing protein [Diplodia seriata]